MGFDFTATPADYVTLTTGKRSHVFFTTESQVFTLTGGPRTGSTYQVRDYYGTIVASGSASPSTITLSLPVGWYCIYILRAASIPTWLLAQGRLCFCVWKTSATLPPRAPDSAPVSNNGFKHDIPARGPALVGPQRLLLHNASDPATPEGEGGDLVQVNIDLDLQDTYYTPYDPVRVKDHFAAFVNGTSGATTGVQVAVNNLKTRIHHWEGTNEPQIVGAAGWIFQETEFYNAVKGADPTAKVLGPCPVSINGPADSGAYKFIDDFFALGGKDVTDAISFHDYNGINGDLTLGRLIHDRFREMRISHGIQNRELWMTEWGAFANSYGVFKPHMQSRWVMMAYMVWEQYGLPKERVSYFYDHSHGFWDFPSFWANGGVTPSGAGSPMPFYSFMRVWSEELFGKTYAKQYGFGRVMNRFTIGSLFTAPGGASVAAFMSSGRTDQTLNLSISGASSVVTVTALGIETTVPVVNGGITLSIENGIPTYVRLPVGVNLYVQSQQYGNDLLAGHTVTASGSGDRASQVTNGIWETWYFIQNGSVVTDPSSPFLDDTSGFPAWVVVDTASPVTLDTIIISCPPPWQIQGTLLDYDIQYWNGSAWVTIDSVNEPTLTFTHKTDPLEGASWVESYYSDRCVFEHRFSPITTTKIRLWVRDTTIGGEPNVLAVSAGGQSGFHTICLRAIEGYYRAGLPSPKYVRSA